MAETTTTRLSLRRWSAGSDTPQRTEFDTNFGNLEALAAIYKQDTFANRPTAGVVGTFFWDTTNSYLWYDNATAWQNIGSRAQDAVFKSSVVGNVPVTVDTPSSQTANLLELKSNGTLKASVTKDGNITGGTYTGVSASLTNATAGTPVLYGKGAASQSAALLQLQNSAASDMFVVSAAGAVTSASAKLDTSSIVNANSATNVTNMSFWSGTSTFEVRANATGAFNDFIYLKHAAAAGTVATRRLGILMKVGDEDATGASQSAAMYLRSDTAAFTVPTFYLDVRDQNMWKMDPSNGSITSYPVYTLNSYLRAQPSGTGAFRASNTWMGTQNSGNDQYYRVANTTNGFYWYGGGVHDDAAGSPGTGGKLYAQLVPEGGGQVKFSTGKLQLNDIAEASVAQTGPTFMIGPSNGMNLIMDNNEIHARSNGVGADLWLQPEAGTVHIGEETVRVEITGNGFAIGNEPVSKQINDVWIDISGSGAVKRWSGSAWIVVAD